jgi:ATP-dependent RNA helicase DeaD
MKKKFSDLGLSAHTLKAINQKGFEEPTTIQELVIPVMLKDDSNIIAQAQTGTGKTAAFGLPLLEMINEGHTSVQVLILTPTRELAIQVSEEINSLKGKRDIRVVPIYGGQSISQQLRRLKKGVHIVVGTPGRVIDHLKRKSLKIDEIEHLILDEADEMLNMGFIDDMEKIMRYTKADKRTLLFSATMPKKIKDLAHKYMEGYEFIKAKSEQLTPNLTEQIYFEVKSADKFEALCRIIDIEDDFYGLVFCRTKSDVDKISSHLKDRGYDAGAIHGDINQGQREKILSSFRKEKIRILIATDVAARGIDVNNLTHVINYSLPQDPESYVHRIGRTGRAGNQGTAITFITPSEYKQLLFIQRIAKTDIKKSKVPGIKDIIDTKKKKIHDDLKSILSKDIDTVYYDWSKKLLEDNEAADVLPAVLSYCFEDELNPKSYTEIKEYSDKTRQVDMQGKARLFVALGKKDKITAKKLVELITKKASVKAKHISDIQVLDKFSFVTVSFKEAENIIVSFRQKGKKPIITHAKKPKKSKRKK